MYEAFSYKCSCVDKSASSESARCREGTDRSDEKKIKLKKKFLSGASTLDGERVGTGLIIIKKT